MNKELELKLVEKYPELLRDYDGDPKVTCLSWGLECSDSWYKILDDLFGYLTNHMKRQLYVRYSSEYREKNEGAFDYAFNAPKIILDQVKSKWACLRAYYHTDFEELPEEIYQNLDISDFNKTIQWYNDRIDSAISYAEYLSRRTCEVTGKEGKVYSGGWWTVMCDEEAIKAGYDPVTGKRANPNDQQNNNN